MHEKNNEDSKKHAPFPKFFSCFLFFFLQFSFCSSICWKIVGLIFLFVLLLRPRLRLCFLLLPSTTTEVIAFIARLPSHSIFSNMLDTHWVRVLKIFLKFKKKTPSGYDFKKNYPLGKSFRKKISG